MSEECCGNILEDVVGVCRILWEHSEDVVGE